MKHVSLRELQATCRRALAACTAEAAVALLAAACSSPDGGVVVVPPQPTGTASPSATANPVATASPKDACRASKPDVTGCGGAEVKLESSLEACGLPADGAVPKERCDELCKGFPTRSCHTFKNREGKRGLFCDAANPCMGRQPSRAVPRGRPRRDPVASHLAFAARMEAASVDAFLELEADLARFGAPPSLLRACRRAAGDEARHAAAMGSLLAQRGASPRPRSRSAARRAARPRGFSSLRALALHNEREGVVGEAVGATLAAYQAEHSPDPSLRAVMRRIAGEELQHAALSLRISAWARRQLGAKATRQLDVARARAADRALATRAPFGTDPTNTLGWPSAEHTAAIVAALARVLVAA